MMPASSRQRPEVILNGPQMPRRPHDKELLAQNVHSWEALPHLCPTSSNEACALRSPLKTVFHGLKQQPF